jgi:hypothetical protein
MSRRYRTSDRGAAQSILDAERAIAQLLAARDDIALRQLAFAGKKDALTPIEYAENEKQIRTRVTQPGRRGCCASPSSPSRMRSRTR